MNRKARRRTRQIRRSAAFITVVFLLIVCVFAVTADTASAEASASRRFKYYTSITVQSGETLWSIAENHRTEEYDSLPAYIREIQNINHLEGTEIISGSTLVIPYYSDDYKV